MGKIKGLISKFVEIVAPTKPVVLRDLIEEESIIGGTIFGKTERNVSRRFFLDEADNWFFTEATYDLAGRLVGNHVIRYQILDSGVIKSVDGKGHTILQGQELQDLVKAVDIYYQRTKKELYEELLGLRASRTAA